MKEKKFRLLLLDANIVIELFRQGIWEKFLESCDVHLSRIVFEKEADYFDDEHGQEHLIDLDPYITSHKITVFDVTPSETQNFKNRFDSEYREKLDDGELESLTHLVNSNDTYLICSADHIVFRVLGKLDLSEQGLSLEEILEKIGLTRKLEWRFTKKFRRLYDQHGFGKRMQS